MLKQLEFPHYDSAVCKYDRPSFFFVLIFLKKALEIF